MDDRSAAQRHLHRDTETLARPPSGHTRVLFSACVMRSDALLLGYFMLSLSLSLSLLLTCSFLLTHTTSYTSALHCHWLTCLCISCLCNSRLFVDAHIPSISRMTHSRPCICRCVSLSLKETGASSSPFRTLAFLCVLFAYIMHLQHGPCDPLTSEEERHPQERVRVISDHSVGM